MPSNSTCTFTSLWHLRRFSDLCHRSNYQKRLEINTFLKAPWSTFLQLFFKVSSFSASAFQLPSQFEGKTSVHLWASPRATTSSSMRTSRKEAWKKEWKNKKSISNPCLWCTNLFTMMSMEFYTNYLSIHSSISNMVVYRIKIIFLLKKSNTPIVHDQLHLSLHINQVTPWLQFNKCNMKTYMKCILV